MENRVRTDRQAPDLLRSALSEFRGARLHATGCVGFLGFPLRLLPIDTRAFALSHRTGFARARLGSRLAVRRWFHPAAPRHKILHRSRPYFHRNPPGFSPPYTKRIIIQQDADAIPRSQPAWLWYREGPSEILIRAKALQTPTASNKIFHFSLSPIVRNVPGISSKYEPARQTINASTLMIFRTMALRSVRCHKV